MNTSMDTSCSSYAWLAALESLMPLMPKHGATCMQEHKASHLRGSGKQPRRPQ